MNEKLTELNEIVANWMNGDDTHTPTEIISKAANLYESENEIPPQLKECFKSCFDYNNNGKQSDTDEYILIEDLSGFLAEYFCD